MQRTRRGKTIEVPEEWVGNFTTKKTRNDRKIKARCKVLERKKRLKSEKLFDIEQEELERGYQETDTN